MTEQEDLSHERLKHHFAQRVTHQARQILEIWQRMQTQEWSPAGLAELSEANLRLLRFAERFDQPEHCELSQATDAVLQQVAANQSRLNSPIITELNRLMQRLSRTGLRQGDRAANISLPPLRKPVYILLQDLERADRLARQLNDHAQQAVVFVVALGITELQSAKHNSEEAMQFHAGYMRVIQQGEP